MACLFLEMSTRLCLATKSWIPISDLERSCSPSSVKKVYTKQPQSKPAALYLLMTLHRIEHTLNYTRSSLHGNSPPRAHPNSPVCIRFRNLMQRLCHVSRNGYNSPGFQAASLRGDSSAAYSWHTRAEPTKLVCTT